jgi:hypothetical protein
LIVVECVGTPKGKEVLRGNGPHTESGTVLIDRAGCPLLGPGPGERCCRAGEGFSVA